MNIIEAVKSGKIFRRKSWTHGESVIEMSDGLYFTPSYNAQRYIPCLSDIIADDWETEEKKVEITRSQIKKAWRKTFNIESAESHSFKTLIKELGL